ncbi:MAG: hypothetical protein ABJA76_00575 [Mucilaginibacter sp.]
MDANIRKIAEILLFEPLNHKGLRDGVNELHRLFSLAAGITAESIDDEDIYLPSGRAISPMKAAHCLLEYQRTATFLRGIYKGIAQLKLNYPGERLHILYAGCGPYATLLTPLTTFLKADEVAFHLLDINGHAIDAAKKLYDSLELKEYVAEWICADATTYKVPEGATMHLMISETMENALRSEPQIDIMMNLIPQLPALGVFIPHEITISAKLVTVEETWKPITTGNQPLRIELGPIYSIGRENAAPGRDITVTIPEDTEECIQLNLFTDIITFDDERLSLGKCSLNIPWQLTAVGEHKGKQLHIHYRMGKNPGFECDWVE